MKRQAVNTRSKFDLASTQLLKNRRAQPVLESRPMSLDEVPLATRAHTHYRSAQVLQSQRASMQLSLF